MAALTLIKGDEDLAHHKSRLRYGSILRSEKMNFRVQPLFFWAKLIHKVLRQRDIYSTPSPSCYHW